MDASIVRQCKVCGIWQQQSNPAEGCCDGCGNSPRSLHGYIHDLEQKLAAAEARYATVTAMLREVVTKAVRHKFNPSWYEITVNREWLDRAIQATMPAKEVP